MNDVPQVRLTGRAARYVALLQDLGHLDLDGADRLIVAGWMESGPSSVIDLEQIRRGAATVLFDPLSGSAMLKDDWPLLFS